MNRRNFLGLLAGGLAAGAAVRSFPFRVFSFPKEIIVPRVGDIALTDIPPYILGAPRSLHGIPYWSDVPPTVGTFYGIARRVTPDESLGYLPRGSAWPKYRQD